MTDIPEPVSKTIERVFDHLTRILRVGRVVERFEGTPRFTAASKRVLLPNITQKAINHESRARRSASFGARSSESLDARHPLVLFVSAAAWPKLKRYAVRPRETGTREVSPPLSRPFHINHHCPIRRWLASSPIVRRCELFEIVSRNLPNPKWPAPKRNAPSGQRIYAITRGRVKCILHATLLSKASQPEPCLSVAKSSSEIPGLAQRARNLQSERFSSFWRFFLLPRMRDRQELRRAAVGRNDERANEIKLFGGGRLVP